MSCCRGRAKTPVYSAHDNTACKEMEELGSQIRLWVMPSPNGWRITMVLKNQFVDVQSFIQGYGCRGPTASIITSNVLRILEAAQLDAATFTRNSSGLPLAQIVKVADSVLKSRKAQHGRKV